MVIKVHGAVYSPPVQRVLACLHEKELDYEFVPIDIWAGDLKKPQFLSINPFGKVPALEDGDLKLWESRAITRYIAHAYDENRSPLVLKGPKQMAAVSVWMEVEAHHFDGPAGKLIRELLVKPLFLKTATDEAVVVEQEAVLAKVLDMYEARLADCEYLGGAHFTLADLHHLPGLEYLMGTRAKALIEARPRVSAWCSTIRARPAWKKVVHMAKNSQ